MVEFDKYMWFGRLFKYIHPAPLFKRKLCTWLYCLIDLLRPNIYAHNYCQTNLTISGRHHAAAP